MAQKDTHVTARIESWLDGEVIQPWITGSMWQDHYSARCWPLGRRSSFVAVGVAKPDPAPLKEPCTRRSRAPKRAEPVVAARCQS